MRVGLQLGRQPSEVIDAGMAQQFRNLMQADLRLPARNDQRDRTAIAEARLGVDLVGDAELREDAREIDSARAAAFPDWCSAIVCAASSAALNACSVEMSGLRAPDFTTAPMPERATSTLLPATTWPCFARSSRLPLAVITTSIASPAAIRPATMPVVLNDSASVCPLACSNSGLMASSAALVAPVDRTLISTSPPRFKGTAPPARARWSPGSRASGSCSEPPGRTHPSPDYRAPR